MCFPVFLKMPSAELTDSRGAFFKEQRRQDRPAAIAGSYRAPVFERQRLLAGAASPGGCGKKDLLEDFENDAGG